MLCHKGFVFGRLFIQIQESHGMVPALSLSAHGGDTV